MIYGHYRSIQWRRNHGARGHVPPPPLF